VGFRKKPDDCLSGKTEFIHDLVMFEGETVTELCLSFRAAVDGYLEMSDELNTSPEVPLP